MARLRLSRRAEADLVNIGGYTLSTWGEEQAVRYLDELDECCRLLAANPTLGRPCQEIRPGLRRIECGAHVIFHRQEPKGVVVIRILHGRMLPERHSFDEEDAG